MGTTLEEPPGVLGRAEGVFFPNSLLGPLFAAGGRGGEKRESERARESEREINDPRTASNRVK